MYTTSFTILLQFALSSPKFVKKEYINNYEDSLIKLSSLQKNISHRVMIAISQKNIEKLQDILIERSDPKSFNYQKWITYNEIGEFTRNQEAYESIVSWLSEHNVMIESVAPRLDYITASATIGTWENMLNTTYYAWKAVRPNSGGYHDKLYHLAEEYSVPQHLDSHIFSIVGTCHIIPILNSNIVNDKQRSSGDLVTRTSFHRKLNAQAPAKYAEISNLNTWYGIPNNLGW